MADGSGESDIVRRVRLLERKIDNGYFVRSELYNSERNALNERIKEVGEQQRWIIRGIVSVLGIVALEMLVIVVMFTLGFGNG